MGRGYQTTVKNGSRELANVLAANGQVIPPMVELIGECKIAVDDLPGEKQDPRCDERFRG